MAEINPAFINHLNRIAATSSATTTSPNAVTGGNSSGNFWGEDGFSFGDILDFLNPLQNIPVVGSIYRAVTGDEISTGSRIIGGGIFGGIIGAGVAVVNAIIEDVSGSDVGEHIIALFDGETTPASDDGAAPIMLASAESQFNGDAPFGHRIQEDASVDWSASEPTAVASLVNAERVYASNPAFGRGAQEATMTSPAFLTGRPTPDSAAPAPNSPAPVIVAEAVEPPAIQTVALAAVQQAPRQEMTTPINLLPETPDSTLPREAIWLSAIPRSTSSYNGTAIRYASPEARLQLAQFITENMANDETSEIQPTSGLSALTRFAIDSYSQQALAAKVMQTEPGVVDILY